MMPANRVKWEGGAVGVNPAPPGSSFPGKPRDDAANRRHPEQIRRRDPYQNDRGRSILRSSPARSMLASLLRPRPRAPYSGVRYYEHVLGTSMELALLADDAGTADRAEARVWAEIDRLEAVFSVYRPDSEFNRWQATHGEDRSVSADLAAVLLAAERYRVVTDGAFLPTVETITRGLRAREAGDVAPDIEALDPRAPLWCVDLPALVARRLTRCPASLNALAKGYILDRAAEAARLEPGTREVMLNLGGDLRHLTTDPAGGNRVAVAIADPAHPEENAPPLAAVLVSGHGVATSGGYRRGFRIDGAWRGHLLDPATGDSVAGSRRWPRHA
ncbi:FAD:protein FMN transferase, partial [bacterium]